jgi:hypothetical protein
MKTLPACKACGLTPLDMGNPDQHDSKCPRFAPARPKTIDLTPTWTAVLPILFAALEDGTPEGKRMAREEIRQMARAADLYNASTKEAR